MEKVEQSMLAHGIVQHRVIPNGVDRSVFHPAGREAARAALNLPREAKVLLFAALGIRQNEFKDYATLRRAAVLLAETKEWPELVFLALGEQATEERIGKASIRFIPFTGDRSVVARYYQAADLYLHAARADTFPNTILEALACATPVIATAVGGIPEQINSLESANPTGVLVPAGDADAMAAAAVSLLRDDTFRSLVAANAARDAAQRFDLSRVAEDYLTWYCEILTARMHDPALMVAEGSYLVDSAIKRV
jgi:glycosyltransferase involved in cell wall biosynthesis